MKARDILLIIIILIVGLGIEAFVKIKEKSFPFFLDIGGKANYFQDEKSIPLQAGGAVIVENSHGNIDFIPWEKDELKVELEKVIYADDYKQAMEISDRIILKLEQKDQTPFVSTNRSELSLGRTRVRTNLKISIPVRLSPSVKIEHGTLSISGIEGNAAIESKHSDGEIRGITGSVNLVSDHSDMRIESVAGGTITVETDHGSGDYSDINGDLKLIMDHGTANVTEAKQNLSITAKNSDVTVRGARGNLAIDSERSSIDVENIEGNATVNNSYDDTKLSNIDGKLDIVAAHGNVEIRNAVSNATIDTEYGMVTFGIPGKMSFSIECTADNGDIKSDFDQLIPREEKLSSRLSGKIGEGGPHYIIKTKYNDIVLNKMIDE